MGPAPALILLGVDIGRRARNLTQARVLRAEWLAQTGASVAERIQACRDILRLQPGNIDAQRVLQSLVAAPREVAARPRDWCTSIVLGVGLSGNVGLT